MFEVVSERVGEYRTTDTRLGVRSLVLVAGLLAAYHALVRPWHVEWGATAEETDRQLPGDELLSDAGSQTTRAVTIDAPGGDVWPWLVQLGQGRGGFYSYAWLENAVGAGIRNADRVRPEFQELAEGDSIRLVREDYWIQSPVTAMTVARLDPGRTLVLRGHDGGTWTFHLDPTGEATTRLLVRGRRPKTDSVVGRAFEYLAYELPHFVMERKMLLGIKTRAERHGER